MTGSPYTRRLFGATLPAAPTWQDIWEAPDDGSTFILRDVRLGNRATVDGEALLDILAEAGTVQLIIAGGLLLGSGTLGGELRQELRPGDVVRVYSPVVGVTVVGTGYVLK